MKSKFVRLLIGSYLSLKSFAFQYNVAMLSKTTTNMIRNSKQSSDMATMPSYYIRDAKQSDLFQVANVLSLSFSPEVNDHIRKMFEMMRLRTTFPKSDDDHLFLVACEDSDDDSDEKIVGFCKVDGRSQTDMFRTLSDSFPHFMDRIPATPYATDLCVHPNNRRSGVGSELMREVELRVKDWDVDYLFLGVETCNQAALNLYLNMGYEEYIEMVGETKRVQLLRRPL